MTEKKLLKLIELSFWVLMIISTLGIFLYDTEFNEPFYFSVKYLTIPIVLLTSWIWWFKLSNWRIRKGFIKSVFMLVTSVAGIILFAGGIVILGNAWVGPQKQIVLSGKIIRMSEMKTGGKGGGKHYLVTIQDTKEKETFVVTVKKEIYLKSRVGDYYSDSWTVGSLGIIYR